MPNILLSFLPWILFFILFGHSEGSKEMAGAVALLSHIIVNRQTIKKGFVLDLGGLLFFAIYTVNAYIFKYDALTNNGYIVSTLAIAMIAWVSLIIKIPFTSQYARLTAPIEIQSSNLFVTINYVLTTLWALLLSLMALPNLIEVYQPIKFSDDISVGMSLLLVVIGC